jgi:hypothetical protein
MQAERIKVKTRLRSEDLSRLALAAKSSQEKNKKGRRETIVRRVLILMIFKIKTELRAGQRIKVVQSDQDDRLKENLAEARPGESRD